MFSARRAPSLEEQRQDAFTQLKAVCVPLLALARAPLTAQSTASTIQLLQLLAQSIAAVPLAVFSPALANYIFFPLSSLLKPGADGRLRGDDVLEHTMRCMERLVRQWRGCQQGIEERLLHELWIMVILTLGGPLDVNKPTAAADKGKGRQRSETCEAAMVHLLIRIMQPLATIRDEAGQDEAAQRGQQDDYEDDGDPLGAEIDWDADVLDTSTPYQPRAKLTLRRLPPSEAALSVSSVPIPIIFHTLTTLLALSSNISSLLDLQQSALQGLQLLIELYLDPRFSNVKPDVPSQLLATALPGAASTLSRIILSSPSKMDPATTRRQPTAVIIASLETLSLLVTRAIGDTVTASLRKLASDAAKASEPTLEELGAQFTADVTSREEMEEVVPSPDEPSTAPANGPALPTPAWLAHTIDRIAILLKTLTPLALHESPLVRTALVSFAGDMLEECASTLGPAQGILLEVILSLSQDSWPTVATPARSELDKLLAGSNASLYVDMAESIVRGRFTGLPRAVLRGDDAVVTSSSKIIQAGLRLAPAFTLASKHGLLGGIERWSWALLRSLLFERVNTNTAADKSSGINQAWISNGDSYMAGPGDGSSLEVAWPTLRLAHLHERETIKALVGLWIAMGRWAKSRGQEREIVAPFLKILADGSDSAVATSAAWVVDGILKGLKAPEDVEIYKPGHKVVKSVVKTVLNLLETMEEEQDEDVQDEVPGAQGPPLTALSTDLESAAVVVEYVKGAASLTPTLDQLKPIVTTSAPAASLRRASNRILLTCLALRILSTSADLVSASFQPHLLQALYYVLSYLSATSHPLLRDHAQLALARIAYSTSYASTQNLLLANVDYIINSVSQRLSLTRLDPSAPLVLVEMIRLVGEPIVPMVMDLVEDVFEALDDYHGYEQVTGGLWAVLDALMTVISIEAVASSRDQAKVMDKLEANQESWSGFQQWYNQRSGELPVDGTAEANPQVPFDTLPKEGDHDMGDQAHAQPEEIKIAPTRSQLVSTQIIAKSLYFLSHSSPFLRARVLSLLASAVPILCAPASAADPESTKESSLLPVIHRAWPYILNRFEDNEPYIVLEAAQLVEMLASHVGTFMSRRILEDVWPRFKTLLAKYQERAKASQGMTGSYSVAQKLYLSMMKTLQSVAERVPMKEDVLWEITLAFRLFLDRQADGALQIAARKLYIALGQVNADVVWLGLRGIDGERSKADSGIILFLTRDELDARDNVRLILSALQ